LAVPAGVTAEVGIVQMKRAVMLPLRSGMGDEPGPSPLLSTAPGPPSPVR
jgi:hypothetical protein